MQHRVTTEYEESRQQVDETLYAVRDSGLPVLWFWPNVDAGSDGTSKGIRVFREKEKPGNFHLFRNMFPEDFLRLLVHATAIVGNSSVAIRECSYLGVPAVNVGSRQQGRERGANVVAIVTEGSHVDAEEVVKIPRTDWLLQPMLAIIPLQLLAYYIARERGLNVDQPRNLAKTVTVE